MKGGGRGRRSKKRSPGNYTDFFSLVLLSQCGGGLQTFYLRQTDINSRFIYKDENHRFQLKSSCVCAVIFKV